MAKPAATKKPAASKASTVPAASARTATAAKADAPANADGQAVVNVPKEGAGPSGTIDVGVNGRFYKVPIGSDVPVNPEVAEVLATSSHKVNTVSPAKGEAAGEGSSAASTTVEGTAIRFETPDEATNGASGNPGEQAHELSQVPDNKIVEQQQGSGDAPPSTKPGA